jgi:hypothetical protein
MQGRIAASLSRCLLRNTGNTDQQGIDSYLEMYNVFSVASAKATFTGPRVYQ